MMIHIDGKYGEGGGQVLRTSLALSMVTGKPFVIEDIRGGRKKPGLLRQHYTAVKAAATVSQAKTSDFAVGTTRLEFFPGVVRGGNYTFSVGSAGSATLVMQTLLPALLFAEKPSRIDLEGGTHNPMAPPMDFIQSSFLPALRQLGAVVNVAVERFGFFPAGGGKFSVEVQPVKKWSSHEIMEMRDDPAIRATAYIAQIPESVAERELRVVMKELDVPERDANVVTVTGSIGPGNALCVSIDAGSVTEVITGFGERGLRSENVAGRVVNQVKRYLKCKAPVGEQLADQLILPMAIGAGGRFRTLPPSSHLETVVEIVKQFLDVEIIMTPTDDIAWDVEIVVTR